MTLQLFIQAYDKGEPESKESTNRARVDVKVIRNEYDPIYFEQTYSANLRGDAPSRTPVTTVLATDADTAVMTSFLKVRSKAGPLPFN